jgi:hypothetical protein
MIINTDLGTVTFTKDETLTIERLGDILDTLMRYAPEDSPEWELNLLTPDVALAILRDKLNKNAERVVFEVVVPSFSDYWVTYRLKGFADGHNECDCPDFEHRGRDKEGMLTGHECKHIIRYQMRMYGLN